MTTAKLITDSVCQDYLQESLNHNKEYLDFKTLCKDLMTVIESEKLGKGLVTQSVIIDWLQGLPSACTVPFTNYDIYQWGYNNGYLKDTDSDSKHINFIDTYFNKIAFVILSHSQR